MEEEEGLGLTEERRERRDEPVEMKRWWKGPSRREKGNEAGEEEEGGEYFIVDLIKIPIHLHTVIYIYTKTTT